MKLSVVIPCYNAAATLDVQLEALAKQQWSQPWEIVLADNGSKDESRQIAENYRGKLRNLRIVDVSEQQSSAFATNRGIEAAVGECLALCDADDEVGDGWVAAMGEALASHDFVGCRMDTTKLNPVWLRGHEQEKGLQMIYYPPWLPHVGGGTMGFRRSLFEELGGFDESMLFLQDTDFCFRAQNRGYVIHFVPDAVLHMRRRRGLLEHFHQSRNYAEYNSILARKYWGGNDSASGFHDQFKRDWIELIFSLKDLCHTGGRFHWVWRFGRQVGRMKALLLRGGIPV